MGEDLYSRINSIEKDKINPDFIIGILSEAEKEDVLYNCCLQLAETYIQNNYGNFKQWQNIVNEVLKSDRISYTAKKFLAFLD